MGAPHVSQGFAAVYGQPPAVEASAPGRVNLIGEHTDYQGGHVLPVAIPWSTWIALRPREDATVHVLSTRLPGSNGPQRYELGREEQGHSWLDYVQGVTFVLREAGHSVRGADVYIESELSPGAGLASSAALVVALLRALRAAFALPIDDVALAVLGRRAETEFVGVPVGIMDQMAASVAQPGHALLLDTRSLRFEHVPLPRRLALLAIDSGIVHGHAQGEYRTRREEAAAAARALGVRELRDATPEAVAGARLPDTLARRARHVVTENARVLAAVDALRSGDLPRLGALLQASHASLRDDYEVSIPEIDALVEIAAGCPGVYGARITGGGFGGSVVAAADAGAAPAAGEQIARAYERRFGRRASVLVCGPPQRAKVRA